MLSEFRARLVAGAGERLLLDRFLERLQARGLIKPRGRQRTDSTPVLGAVRVLNRLERVGESLRAALNSLAVVAPDWLRAQVPAEWYERYGRRIENYDLPKTEADRQALAALIGTDGQHLLQALEAGVDRVWLQEVAAIKTLRQVWSEAIHRRAGPAHVARGQGDAFSRGADCFAVRPRGLVQHQARDRVGRLQSPPNRDLR